MESGTDTELLERWRTHRDAHAFKTLAQRYGGLVHSICCRVLKNRADAEEVAQECFLKLAQHPRPPRESVGAWLHSVAVRGSLNRIRSEQRRRKREAAYEAGQPPGREPAIDDLLCQVDEAVDGLPEDLRRCVVGYFLENKSQQLVAEELGVTTRTVRRRTDDAIRTIRASLARRGIVTTTGALATALAGLEAGALPHSLEIALGKIAVGGTAANGTKEHWAVADHLGNKGGMTMGKQAGMALVGVCIVSAAAWWGLVSSEPDTPPPGTPLAAAPETVATPVAANATPEAVHPAATDEPRATGDESPPAGAALSGLDAIPAIANPTRYARLSGMVTDDAGRPVAGATVRLVVAGIPRNAVDNYHVAGFPAANPAMDPDLAWLRRSTALARAYALPGHQYEAVSDDDGAFRIEKIKYSGTAMVAADAEGYALDQKGLELEENKESSVKLALYPGNTLVGRVQTPEGSPVANARIAPFSVTVRSDHIRGTSKGAVTASDGGRSSGGSFGASGGTSGGSGGSGGFGGGGSAGGSGASFGGGGGFSSGGGGFGGGGSGHAVSSGSTSFTPVPAPFQTRTDADGLFRLNVVRAHEVGLLISGEAGGTAGYRGVPVGRTEPVPLSFAYAPGALSGQLVRPGGDAARGHFVHLQGAVADRETTDVTPNRPSGSVQGSAFYVATDNEGRFHVDAMPAGETYRATIYDPKGRSRGEADVPAIVAGDTRTWKHGLPPLLTVVGRVVGVPSGAPITEAKVVGLPGGGQASQVKTKTGADGRFELAITGTETTVALLATLSPWIDMDGAQQSVALAPDEVREVLLEIPDPWSRSFQVVDPAGRPLGGIPVTELTESASSGGSTTRMVDDLVTDNHGRVDVDNLASGVSTQVSFGQTGYLDAVSTEAEGTPGEAKPVEVITLYPAVSATGHVVGEDGTPIGPAELLCELRYGDGRSDIRRVAIGNDGRWRLDGCLPATVVDLELRLVPGASTRTNLVVSSFGSMPEHFRRKMLGYALSDARRAGTPDVVLQGVDLAGALENDLGSITLTAGR